MPPCRSLHSVAMSDGSSSMRLVVLDDDSGFVRVLSKRLETEGWQFRVFASTVAVDELVAMRAAALVVDISLAGREGWGYLEKVSASLPEMGLIVTMNGGTVSQRVRGLRSGADDWINKPCHPEEVIARVEAVVRRRTTGRGGSLDDSTIAGEVEIRPDLFQAFVGGESIGLTRREFELLALLVGRQGNVLERETIYQQVWGYAMAHGDRSVDVFVRKLRHKLASHSPSFRYIHTHFGIGYRFDAESAEGDVGRPAADGEKAAPRDRAESPAPSAR